MFLKRFSYSEPGWCLQPLTFGTCNLLAGAAGVGKSQILSALVRLRDVASGQPLPGAEWELDFQQAGVDYSWSGHYDSDSDGGSGPCLSERLERDGQELITRTAGKIIYAGAVLPDNFAAHLSIFKVLEGDDLLRPLRLHKRFASFQMGHHFSMPSQFLDVFAEITDLKVIRNSGLHPLVKAFLVHENRPDLFADCAQAFMQLFPRISDIRMELIRLNAAMVRILCHFRDGGHWQNQNSLSSGMWKAWLLLSKVHFLAIGAVLLVDDYDDGLGPGCRELFKCMRQQAPETQMLLAVHQTGPFTDIPCQDWRLLAWSKGRTQGRCPSDLGLSNASQIAHHQAFTSGCLD